MALITCNKRDDGQEIFNDLLPAGMRLLKIISADIEKSAKGNENLVVVFEDIKTGARNKFWFSVETGKRWHYRNLVEVTGLLEENIDGDYTLDTVDLRDLNIGAFIFHAEEPYTTKDFVETTRKKAKIKRFYTEAAAIEAIEKETKKNDEEIPF
jgi:hypothetical protein